MAANVIKRNGNVVVIQVNEDWNWRQTFTEAHFQDGIPIYSISFYPGAASDSPVIRNGFGSTAPELFGPNVCADVSDQKREEFGGGMFQPVLNYSEGTYTNPAKIKIILKSVF